MIRVLLYSGFSLVESRDLLDNKHMADVILAASQWGSLLFMDRYLFVKYTFPFLAFE